MKQSKKYTWGITVVFPATTKQSAITAEIVNTVGADYLIGAGTSIEDGQPLERDIQFERFKTRAIARTHARQIRTILKKHFTETQGLMNRLGIHVTVYKVEEEA